jgi:hypothetical protein
VARSDRGDISRSYRLELPGARASLVDVNRAAPWAVLMRSQFNMCGEFMSIRISCAGLTGLATGSPLKA